MNKVGYFGIQGSYSYVAAQNYFKREGEYISYPTFKDIFDGVLAKTMDYGVVPYKNSIAGDVAGVQALLESSTVNQVDEVTLAIEHCLLGISSDFKGASLLNSIHKVYAHPQALAQCSNFFEDHPWMEQLEFQDNASAAQFVSQLRRNDCAAIASEEAGRLYGLDIIARQISNTFDNTTTFIIISF